MLPLLIWESDPFSRQQVANEKQCSFCGKQFLIDITTCTNDNGTFMNNSSNKAFCHCSSGCGASYCSPECCLNDKNTLYHERLCVGRYSEDHPLYQFKVLAIESGNPEVYSTLMLSLTLMVIQCATQKSAFEDEWLTTTTTTHFEEDEDVHTFDDGEDGTIVDSSYELLLQILSTESSINDDDDNDHNPNYNTISRKKWGCLLASVNQRRITIEIPSIWSNFCRAVTKSNEWTDDHPLLKQARSMWNNEEEEEDGGDSNDEPSMTVVDIVHLMDEPDYYFPSLKCSTLFSPEFYSTIKHSCVPNHEIMVQDGGYQNNINSCFDITLQKLSKSEFEETSSYITTEEEEESITTISLIDTEDDLETRTEELALRGISYCTCERCVLERFQHEETDEEDVLIDDISNATLGRLLGLAKAQQRHDDSFFICDLMLRQNPSDPKILLHRSRVAGWMGDFSSRESFLEQAEAILPGDLAIQQALAETRAYYQNKSDGITDEVGSSNSMSFTFNKIDGLNGDAFTIDGLLRKDDCAQMIDLAEKHQSKTGGWTTSRHFAVPTTDVPIYQMPLVLDWFNRELERCIFPVLQQQFNPSGRLRIFDAFFVKYDSASGQRRLPLHNDQSVYSLTIAMNGLDGYQGGGTYFAKIGEAIKTDVGGIVSFKGELVHAGKQLQGGIRYIIACFIYVENA